MEVPEAGAGVCGRWDPSPHAASCSWHYLWSFRLCVKPVWCGCVWFCSLGFVFFFFLNNTFQFFELDLSSLSTLGRKWKITFPCPHPWEGGCWHAKASLLGQMSIEVWFLGLQLPEPPPDLGEGLTPLQPCTHRGAAPAVPTQPAGCVPQLTGWQYPVGVTVSMGVLRFSPLLLWQHTWSAGVAGWPQPFLGHLLFPLLHISPTLLCVPISQHSFLMPPFCSGCPGWASVPCLYRSSWASTCIFHLCCPLSFCFCSPCSTDHLLTSCPSSLHDPCAGGQSLWVP